MVSKFDTKEKKFLIELAMDIYPSEDPSLNDEISPEDAANFFSNEALMLFFGDTQIKPESKTQLIKDPDADPEIEEVAVKVVVSLFGEIPEDAGHFTLRVSPDTTAAVVMVTFKDGKPGRRAEVLYPGEFSTPVDMTTVIEEDPFAGVEDGSKSGDTEESPDSGSSGKESIPDEESSENSETEGVSGSGSPVWGELALLLPVLLVVGALFWAIRRFSSR